MVLPFFCLDIILSYKLFDELPKGIRKKNPPLMAGPLRSGGGGGERGGP